MVRVYTVDEFVVAMIARCLPLGITLLNALLLTSSMPHSTIPDDMVLTSWLILTQHGTRVLLVGADFFTSNITILRSAC